MEFGNRLLHAFFTEGNNIRRSTWPKDDYISADGAEGGTIWYYSDREDELTKDYKLGFHDLAAGDWEVA